MKIKFELLSTSNGIISNNYQNMLCGAFYDAIRTVDGYENYHDQKNLHSISQLTGTKRLHDGSFIPNPKGNGILQWVISSPQNEILLNAAKNLFEKKSITKELEIFNYSILPLTVTGDEMKFIVQSPVILKKDVNGERHYYVVDDGDPEKTQKKGNKTNYYIHRDNEMCSQIMMEIVKSSADILGFDLDPKFSIRFDETYENKKVRRVTVKIDKKSGNEIYSVATTCPIIIKGNPDTINFIYDLGVGHSTGMGFGSLA